MIVSDRHRFAFVHIPKCAGTTVRMALAEFDERSRIYHGCAVAEHPALGRIDHAHIPLAHLRTHFPEDFSCLETYRSFALLRDPFERFPSSLHERLVQARGPRLDELAPGELAWELDRVMRALARLPAGEPVTDPALIHFSRQSDYVLLDGRQIVRELHPTSRVAELVAEIGRLAGRCIRLDENVNMRLRYGFAPLARLDDALRGPIERALPRRVWKPVFRRVKGAFLRLGILERARDPLGTLGPRDEIEAFVREFYAEDIRLHRALAGDRRERGGGPG